MTALPATPALDALHRELDAFGDGYTAGFFTGQRTGFAQGEAAEAQLWSEAMGLLQQAGNRETHAELVRRRAEDPWKTPCGSPRCADRPRCSRCVRTSWVRRHRGEYHGRPAA